ncbi:MAG TPA: hypothetical protein VEU51_12155 [Candidatus Acidoferrales bacterium]|nr:hypothetical protein [Candidatus Acidoferrales bacterium]
MERRNNSLIFVLLAAFAGMFAFTPRATESAPPSHEAAPRVSKPAALLSASTTESEGTLPALTMIEEFYYGGKGTPHNPGERVKNAWLVDSIIAVLPDPVESALGDQFDNFLDAIQRALADTSYVLDRFNNPWPLPATAAKSLGDDKNPSCTGADTDPTKPQYACEPGMMLFRRAADHKLMVVFLVGETPTRGIHKSAFKNALEQALEIAEKFPSSLPAEPDVKGNRPIIRVMGPSFSGSASSMTFALRSWLSGLAPGRSIGKIKIISGSATAIKKNKFEDDLGAVSKVTYQATLIRDEYVLKQLLEWLRAPRGDGVAFLHEEDTAYGSVAADYHSLNLSFPLHIAELQRAMLRAEANSKAGAPQMPLLQNPNLPLGTEEAQTRVDVFPLFSNSETNSLELLLDGVMRTITDRRIKYVVIVATDIEDTMFLARRIRESCPNVTPIALNGDVLFLHSAVNTYLRGMIVASTYPLYFENQFWTRPVDSNSTALIQFPSDTSEGVYNATLALMGRTDALLDYAQPFDRDSKRPPVWISMVGSDQFWPLATFAVEEKTADYLVESETPPPAAKFANPTFIVYPSPFLLLCAIVGIGSLVTWRLCTHAPNEKSRGFDYAIYRLRTMLPVFLQQSFAAAPGSEYVESRRAIVFMFLMALFGLSTTVACFFFLPLRTDQAIRSMVLRFDPRAGIWPLAFLLAVAALIAAISFWSDRIALDASVRSELRRGGRWDGAAAAAVALVVLLWMGLAPTDSAERIFFFFRIIDLDGGASPLVPLLLVYGACFVMLLGAMRRRTFVEARLLDTPFLGFQTDSFRGVAELEAQLRDVVYDDGWKSWQWWTAVGVVSAAYVVYFRPWESTIDGTIFMLVFFAFSLAAYLGIATALLRLLTVWGATRRLLQRIFWHPSRDGYGKLRDTMSARDAAIDLFSPAPTVTALEAGLADLRLMLRQADSPAPHGNAVVWELLQKFRTPLTEGLAASEAALNCALQAGALRKWDCEIAERRKTEARFDYVSKVVARIFEPLWRTRVDASLQASAAPAESDKSPPLDPAGDIFVATRVVDLLRQVMPQLRTLAITSTVAMLMMLFAISAYPFPTRDHLLWFSWEMVLAAAASILWMYFSFNRDRVVSLICGTTPGHLDWNSTLLTQLLTHGLLPILVLLGAAYPAELGRLAQWAGGLFGGRG